MVDNYYNTQILVESKELGFDIYKASNLFSFYQTQYLTKLGFPTLQPDELCNQWAFNQTLDHIVREVLKND